VVEINVTFYRLPTKESFKRWYKITPNNFFFAVKAPKYITHIKKLNNISNFLDYFFEMVETLKTKLKVILFQMPPSLKYDLERLETFIKLLPTGFKYAFEFRKQKWFTDEVVELFKKYKICLTIPIAPGIKGKFISTANFTYLRFHGKKNWYSDFFKKDELKKYYEQVKAMKGIRSCFVFFNNDNNAYAVEDAKIFKSLVENE
jgi:uncharacterized protein YecE (DUF72 family)